MHVLLYLHSNLLSSTDTNRSIVFPYLPWLHVLFLQILVGMVVLVDVLLHPWSSPSSSVLSRRRLEMDGRRSDGSSNKVNCMVCVSFGVSSLYRWCGPGSRLVSKIGGETHMSHMSNIFFSKVIADPTTLNTHGVYLSLSIVQVQNISSIRK